jgi:glycosyltransferase involved in cell wall biosynthesis
MAKLSIVVPVYFNASTLQELHAELSRAIDQAGSAEAEMIFVDDGSGDNSFDVLCSLARVDSRCRIVKLSRNHGSWIAALAGLHSSSGDCAILISADLQDPPCLIPKMYGYWLEGFPVVLAVRDSREDPVSTKVFAAIFHGLMRRFAVGDYPTGGCDLALIDRRIIDALIKMQEKNSHLIAQVLWTGYSRKLVYYRRQKRRVGKSRWTFFRKLKLFIDSFTAFSYFPLRLMSSTGIFIAALGFLYALVILSRKLFYGVTVEGWTSLMVVILVVSGAFLIGIGVIGEYLWRVLEEVRKRPAFFVEKTIGCDQTSSTENPQGYSPDEKTRFKRLFEP